MNVFDSVGKFADKHSPEILLGAGIAGMLTTAVLSVRATPKAIKSIEAKKKEKRKTKLTIGETIAASWKYYILPFVTFGASTAALVGSNNVQNKRVAALATSCALWESGFKRYAEKVVETVGEKKEQQIRDKVAAEQVKENPVRSAEVLATSGGESLCYDSKNKLYFRSCWSKIEKAENTINKQLNTSEDPELFVPLNDFFYELGLPSTDYGKMVGWRRDVGYLKVQRSCQLTDDGTPVLVIDYRFTDKYGKEQT